MNCRRSSKARSVMWLRSVTCRFRCSAASRSEGPAGARPRCICAYSALELGSASSETEYRMSRFSFLLISSSPPR